MDDSRDATYIKKAHPHRPFYWKSFSPSSSSMQIKEEMWKFLMSLGHTSTMTFQRIHWYC